MTPDSLPEKDTTRCKGFWGWLLGHRYRTNTSRYESGLRVEYAHHHICTRCSFIERTDYEVYFRDDAASRYTTEEPTHG